jgi:hypothetical protein
MTSYLARGVLMMDVMSKTRAMTYRSLAHSGIHAQGRGCHFVKAHFLLSLAHYSSDKRSQESHSCPTARRQNCNSDRFLFIPFNFHI